MSSKFSFNKKDLSKTAIVSLVLILIMSAGQFYSKTKRYEIPTKNAGNKNEISNEIPYSNPESDTPKDIVVHIVGAVKTPSVVEIESGSRLYQAVEKAGGFLENADQESINLAQELVDGSQYIIPKKGEKLIINKTDGTTAVGFVSENDGKININTADAVTLQNLDGIGEVLAKRIVEYRNKNGKFGEIADLLQIEGIGDNKFENIKDKIYCK